MPFSLRSARRARASLRFCAWVLLSAAASGRSRRRSDLKLVLVICRLPARVDEVEVFRGPVAPGLARAAAPREKTVQRAGPGPILARVQRDDEGEMRTFRHPQRV